MPSLGALDPAFRRTQTRATRCLKPVHICALRSCHFTDQCVISTLDVADVSMIISDQLSQRLSSNGGVNVHEPKTLCSLSLSL